MADKDVKIGYDGLNLPYSPEAEQAVLGAVILDNRALDDVVEILGDSKFFYVAAHRVIYSAMLDLFNTGKSVDFVTLLEVLKRDRQFDDATGKTYLMDLADNCPSISNAPEYAKIVREKYDIRRLITASRDIIDEASAGEYEPKILIDSAEQKILI